MKKLIAFLLLLTMTFTFCACQGDNPAQQPIAEKEFSLGVTSGDTYESEFIGIGCELEDGWTFYSEEQIKQLNSAATDMAGEEYQKLVEQATVVYDMYACDASQLNNININLEKAEPSEIESLNFKENFELLAPTITQTFENMGYTNAEYEVTTVNVDGKTLDALRTTAEIQGIKMYQAVFSVKCNGYIASAAVTTYYEDTINDILDRFYWL